MRRKILVLVCLLVIALMVASTVPVGAAKPPKDPKPPPGKDDGPTGTIYFQYWDSNVVGHIYSMNADGTSKTKVVQWADGMTSMSLKTHGDEGHYWYAGFIKTDDDPHPDGTPKTELWAIRDDNGDSELLLADDTMSFNDRYNGPPVWLNGDAQLSWAAIRWEGDNIIEAGIYKADITFSGGVPSMPDPDLVWSTDPFYHTGHKFYIPEVRYPSWNPDGLKVVMNSYENGHTVVDFTTGIGEETILGGFGMAFWSPDGTKLAHLGLDTDRNLYVMNPDGTGDTLLVSRKLSNAKDNDFDDIRWSPDSKFLMYTNCFFSVRTWRGHSDVCIIGIDGSGYACLTNDVTKPDYIRGRDWR